MIRRQFIIVILAVFIVTGVGLSTPEMSLAEDYSFDMEEFEKKSFSWAGYAELNLTHNWLNQDGAFGLLGLYKSPRSDLDRLQETLQLEGNYNKDNVDFNWRLQGSGETSQTDSEKKLTIMSAYASIKPSPSISLELGKKTFKWGKGYAWNPVAFIDRQKDPNNPEEALEGYIGVGFDWIKSFSDKLQTLALTGVVLPVREDINDDFGELNHLNFAAKLYLLYKDTDIDFILFSGGSRSTSYGVDFSRNLATNFEIHGEIAHIPKREIKVLNSSGMLETHEISTTNYLLGVRYLSESNITTILEYYYNDAGFSEEEMDQFYQMVSDANTQYQITGDDSLLQKTGTISKNYARPQIGRNYLYSRVTQKEPFDLLYFTPGITAIFNLDDKSYSLTPEAAYSGFTNWEMRLRYTQLIGGRFTEYGEKANESKVEFRIRYYF
jgi:hypothetical protein